MTSKADSPPPYEDALTHPKYGSDPLQPQHDSRLPPPSYGPEPATCPRLPGYWGQPAALWAAPPGFPPSGGPVPVAPVSAGASAASTGGLR